jgi:hypothetical protein
MLMSFRSAVGLKATPQEAARGMGGVGVERTEEERVKEGMLMLTRVSALQMRSPGYATRKKMGVSGWSEDRTMSCSSQIFASVRGHLLCI